MLCVFANDFSSRSKSAFFGLGTVSDGKCMVNDLGWFNRLSKIIPEYKKISRLL